MLTISAHLVSTHIISTLTISTLSMLQRSIGAPLPCCSATHMHAFFPPSAQAQRTILVPWQLWQSFRNRGDFFFDCHHCHGGRFRAVVAVVAVVA